MKDLYNFQVFSDGKIICDTFAELSNIESAVKYASNLHDIYLRDGNEKLETQIMCIKEDVLRVEKCWTSFAILCSKKTYHDKNRYHLTKFSQYYGREIGMYKYNRNPEYNTWD